jgi:DNA primase
MITPYSIDKILSVARIEEVISDFVALKKRGINFVGLCPFHNEKTPSFTVSPTKGIYKCFGCGSSGNVVKFLMDHEKLSYPDALRWLAKKYNIIIEEVEETEETKKEKSERDKVLEVLQFAQKFFTNVLLTTDEGKEIGLNYLYNKRKIDFSLIQKFQLGYSPSNKRSFTDLALQAGFTPEILVKAGLVNCPDCEENKPIDVHKIYDKFFARVIFPICDISGKVIGFGGRTLSDDKSIAKYINSPQTIVYDKSKTLYGIHLAKKAIMQNDLCYLVEGYADVISLHKAGIENVVASSGTSLTTEQVKLIHRFTNNVIVLYDGDAAGIKAGIRAIDMLLEEGLNVKIVMFPDGDNPDSFVNKHSNQEVFDFLKNNEKDFIQFKKELYHSENQSPIEKAKAIEEILTSVARIPNEIQRRVYIQTLSNDLKIEESTLLRNVQKIRQDIYLKKEKIQIED